MTTYIHPRIIAIIADHNPTALTEGELKFIIGASQETLDKILRIAWQERQPSESTRNLLVNVCNNIIIHHTFTKDAEVY